MENLWNMKEISHPPISTYKANSCNIDIQKFQAICEDFKIFLTTHPHLHSEYLILSRITYRMKQKFRTSKDFKALEKLTKSVGRYFGLNLSKDLQSFMDLLPENYSDEFYLPTKNLVDYILVRLQGVGKLFEYIMQTSVEIADMLCIRIQTGHFWRIGFILFSIISRIYVLSKHIIKLTCNLYSQLLSISPLLMYIGKRWLPANYILPDNLESWLDIDILKMDQDFQKFQEPTTVNNIVQYFNLVEDSDSDLEFTELSSDSKEVYNSPKPIKRNEKYIHNRIVDGFMSEEDIGQIIEILSDDNSDVSEKNRISEKRQNQSVLKSLGNVGKKNKSLYSNKRIMDNKDFFEIIRPNSGIQEVNTSLKGLRSRVDSNQVIDISDDSINGEDIGVDVATLEKQINHKALKSLGKVIKKRKKSDLKKKIKKNKDFIDVSNSVNKVINTYREKKKKRVLHRQHARGEQIHEIIETSESNRNVTEKLIHQKMTKSESKKKSKKKDRIKNKEQKLKKYQNNRKLKKKYIRNDKKI